MKKFRMYIISICFLLSLILFTGCGQNSTESNSENNTQPKIAYYAYFSEPFVDLDPSIEYSNGIVTLHNVYETLTKYNHETEKVEALLAENWQSDESGKVWTFKIKKGVKFHDGADLNADAVKKSLERTINLKMGASYIWDSVEKINVVDDNTVEFVLKYAAPIDLIASASYSAFIMSPNVVDKDSAWFNEGNEGGTGPYTIQKITKGEEIVLSKFDDYWRGWKPNQFDKAIIKKSSESSSRRQLVEKGEAQITNYLSVSDVKALKENTQLETIDSPSWKNVIGFFNTQKKPLDNEEFRIALSYAFPYEEVVKNVREDQAVQSYGLIPEGLWGHDKTLPRYQFDLAKAQEHLAKSGVKTEGLTLEMTITSGNEDHKNAAQLYQVNLKKLGINLEIREMNWDSVWEKAKNKNPNDRQDMVILVWWPDYPSPTSWLNTFLHSEENIYFNLSYVNDPNLDAMIEQGDELTTTDRAKAEELFKQAQLIAIERAYQINMYDDKKTWITTKDFKGFKASPVYEDVVFFYDTYLGEE